MKKCFPFVFVLLLACGASEDAARIRAEVHTPLTKSQRLETDLGYEVELVEARVVAQAIHFLVPERMSSRMKRILFPRAWAHPGHHHGGEIAGELVGPLLIDWIPGGRELGHATLLPGSYAGAAYSFTPGAGKVQEEPLFSHVAFLQGVAKKEERSQAFVVRIRTPPRPEVDGIPFQAGIVEGERPRLELRLVLRHDGESLFDGVDFLALGGGNDMLLLSSEAESEAAREAFERISDALFDHRFHEVRASR